MPRKRRYIETGEKKEPSAVRTRAADEVETVDGVSGEDNSTENAKSQASRTRNYAFLVYPDSAPADWRERIDAEHVEALISPLHDRDVNPDGSAKKAHHHVMVMYSSVKTLAQAQALRDKVGGVGWENIASARGYARYLIHADNPEKFQYDRADVVEVGGADYDEVTRRSADGIRALREMMKYVRENNVLWYSDFVEYCMDERDDWYELLATRYTYAIREYIKARATRARMSGQAEYSGEMIDPMTGEILEG